jgi:phage tail tape-measure protein
MQRDANGVIRPIRNVTYEIDQFGQATRRGQRSFSQMLQQIGGNLFVYGAITAGFFAITLAIRESIDTMAQFENQMLRVDNMSRNFSDFGKGKFEGDYNPASGIMAQYDDRTVSKDAFDISTNHETTRFIR